METKSINDFGYQQFCLPTPPAPNKGVLRKQRVYFPSFCSLRIFQVISSYASLHVLELIERQISSAAVNEARKIFFLSCSFSINFMSSLGSNIQPVCPQTDFGSYRKIDTVQLLTS